MGIISNSMERTIFLVLSLSSLLLALASANKGHISMEFSNKGIDFAKDVLIDKALTSIIPLQLPDIEKSVRIPIVGTRVRVGLSNITVYSASVGFSSLEATEDGAAIVIVASGIEADLDMNWFYSYKGWIVVISDSGGASVKVNDMEVRLLLDVKEQEGTLKLSLLSCECSVNNISIDLNGGASWLYQVVVDAFERPIRSTVEKAVSKKIEEGIAKLDSKLQSIPKQIAADHLAALNITVVGDPSLSNSAIGFEVDGLFVAADDNFGKYCCRGMRGTSGSCSDSSKMLAILLQQDVFDSAASVYFSAGYMHWIVDKFIDQSVLNTSSWKSIYPELYEQYPDDTVNLNVSVVSPPAIKILENDIDATIDLDVVVNVLDADEITPVAIISLVINTTATPEVVGRNLAGTIKLKNFTMVLKWSRIGNLNLDLLEPMTSKVLETIFTPYVNKRLIKGFPLPIIHGFTLRDAEIHCAASGMLICSDFATT